MSNLITGPKYVKKSSLQGILLVYLWLCSEGRGFDSQHRTIGLTFFIFVVEIVMFVCKDENELNRGRICPIFIKSLTYLEWILLLVCVKILTAFHHSTIVSVPNYYLSIWLQSFSKPFDPVQLLAGNWGWMLWRVIKRRLFHLLT